MPGDFKYERPKRRKTKIQKAYRAEYPKDKNLKDKRPK